MVASLLQERDEAGSGRTPHLSHSRISRYLLCPEQYRLYYQENLRPITPAATLVFGQLVHQALAHLFKTKADPVKSFQDTWSALKEFPLAFKERDSWDKLKACGEALLQKFVAEERPKLSDITAVEQRFELAISGVDTPFIGVIDLLAKREGKLTVVDFKTAAAAYGEHEAALSDQLTAYKLKEPGIEQLALCVLVKTKEPKIEWHLTNRTGEALTEYLAKVGYVAGEIAAGRFYKRPGMWCSWCDFLPVCLGDRKKAEESLVQVA